MNPLPTIFKISWSNSYKFLFYTIWNPFVLIPDQAFLFIWRNRFPTTCLNLSMCPDHHPSIISWISNSDLIYLIQSKLNSVFQFQMNTQMCTIEDLKFDISQNLTLRKSGYILYTFEIRTILESLCKKITWPENTELFSIKIHQKIALLIWFGIIFFVISGRVNKKI